MSNSKYFTGIDDIILANWWKIREGDYRYCRRNLKEGNKSSDLDAFIKINDTYLLEFGLGAEMERIIELRREITLLQCDYIIENNNYLRNQIRRLTGELVDLMTADNDGLDRDSVIILLEKWRGVAIDENKITARKYYKIVEVFEKEQAIQAKQNG